MDMDFIELQHRENVLKLMEICGLDMNEAYQLYIQSGYNFQVAVNKKFNPAPLNHSPFIQPDPIRPNHHYAQQIPNYGNEFDEEDDDYKYSQYKKFIANGRPFDQRYPARKHQSFLDRLIPSFFKKEPQDPFKTKLEKYIDKRINLKNTIGNLSEVLEWSWKEKYPALIMILDFAPDLKQSVKKIFSEDVFIQQVLNIQFKLYGLNPYQYDLQEELKPIFNFERDVNHFIVCRVNYLQQIQIMHRIRIEPYEELKKKLKQIKSQCIQIEMEQSNIVKQYHQQRKGNFNYRRPRTIKQNIKMKEDRKIRKQQQQQFYKAVKPNLQLPNVQKNKKPQKQQQYKHPQKIQKKVQKKQITEEQIRAIRQSQFKRLKKYESGIGFKIRVPSGQNIIINVDPEENVQYLFSYISNEPNDLGFSNDIKRQFDIFVGFGGSLRLKGKQNQKLKSLFEDSQVLIVRETETE